MERQAGVISGAKVVVADGNLPPEGFAQVARLCARENVPLVFEPTSVAKSSVPFLAGVSLFLFFKAAQPTPSSRLTLRTKHLMMRSDSDLSAVRTEWLICFYPCSAHVLCLNMVAMHYFT